MRGRNEKGAPTFSPPNPESVAVRFPGSPFMYGIEIVPCMLFVYASDELMVHSIFVVLYYASKYELSFKFSVLSMSL